MRLVGEYLELVVRAWWGVLAGVVFAALSAVEYVTATRFPLPAWAWLLMAFAALSLSQFGAFRRVAVERDRVKTGLENALTGEAQTHRSAAEVVALELEWNQDCKAAHERGRGMDSFRSELRLDDWDQQKHVLAVVQESDRELWRELENAYRELRRTKLRGATTQLPASYFGKLAGRLRAHFN